ncbi:MBL fold metallo-hydrolase [Haladaptatus sp. T7]|uniref:MBL fold metallo-hydrolase n=1 Tax=Haladaptatus sp. T7 TaxID=2029368 RepID=UPI0021A2558B|nr:MBL fold metallo-hydrolase [Haladaptatus sp. T7]GKZ15842.1 MBL fold hydrolase [Haladaptatus sp. T7]
MNRIRLENSEFEGENSVYLLGTDTDAPTTLIDTSVRKSETLDSLESGLADYGCSVGDVDRVLVTHWHTDHAGLAGTVQARSDAAVFVHEDDAALVAQDESAWDAIETRQRRLLDEWGLPEHIQDPVFQHARKIGRLDGPEPTVEPFSAGDRFDCGDVELEAVHLPGHTAGLSGFAFDGDSGRGLFCGDALLGNYTPNVGGADVRLENPLAAYLDTLSHVVGESYERAWPGHGGPLDPTERAREIRDHHRDRAGDVIDVLERHGPTDPWTVGSHLFGDLDGIHLLHGPGESYAHLRHLAEAGYVERVGDEYELVEQPDLDALFEDRMATSP